MTEDLKTTFCELHVPPHPHPLLGRWEKNPNYFVLINSQEAVSVLPFPLPRQPLPFRLPERDEEIVVGQLVSQSGDSEYSTKPLYSFS